MLPKFLTGLSDILPFKGESVHLDPEVGERAYIRDAKNMEDIADTLAIGALLGDYVTTVVEAAPQASAETVLSAGEVSDAPVEAVSNVTPVDFAARRAVGETLADAEQLARQQAARDNVSMAYEPMDEGGNHAQAA